MFVQAGAKSQQAIGRPAFLPRPEHCRVFTAARSVRSTEVTLDGQLRFDALARYLQEAAEDDLADAGFRAPAAWLVRRARIDVCSYPLFGAQLELSTFCSGIGPRWAQRTTTVTSAGEDLIQARVVWVPVGLEDGDSLPIDGEFLRVFGASAGGRRVSARLSHPAPPRSAASRPWPLRVSDFDTAGHVNNAVHWIAVEELLAGRGWRPASAEMEYRRPILPGCDPVLASAAAAGGELSCWLLSGQAVLSSARLAA